MQLGQWKTGLRQVGWLLTLEVWISLTLSVTIIDAWSVNIIDLECDYHWPPLLCCDNLILTMGLGSRGSSSHPLCSVTYILVTIQMARVLTFNTTPTLLPPVKMAGMKLGSNQRSALFHIQQSGSIQSFSKEAPGRTSFSSTHGYASLLYIIIILKFIIINVQLPV